MRRRQTIHLTPILMMALLALATWPVPGGAEDTNEEGHWEHLGEDGSIWVPAEAPETTALPPPDLGAYHNHTEMVDALSTLASERPDLFTLETIGASVQGRDIVLMRVTGATDPSALPRVLFDGAHHGNEVIGSEILVRFLLDIHERYDDEAALRDLLDEVVVDVVPMVNVDGVQRIPQCSHYAMCRKNTNGVDLNRNYADHWGGPGSSGDPGGATYRGPEPASEPETQVISGLLDTHDYALHASLHSGIELILWPHGWTTTPPAEAGIYGTLGDELTDLTGVPNGQTSRILYSASGTTMDQAAGSAAGWRAMSFSPEVYGGSGSAFDWWNYFNPPETESGLGPVVQRWQPALWHLVQEAPAFRPATITGPSAAEVGPDEETLSFSVASALRRPFLDGRFTLELGDAPVHVHPEGEVSLPDGHGPHALAFSLLAERGGQHPIEAILDAGPAGRLGHGVDLTLVQVGMGLALSHRVMGSPQENRAEVTVSTGPFDAVHGNVTFRLEPTGSELLTLPFAASPDEAAHLEVTFDAMGLERGMHEVVAEADFVALLDGAPRVGRARVAEPFEVVRPEVVLDKRFPAQSALLEPVPILSLYRNIGNLAAEGVVVEERVPPGYAYWVRDGPVPVPTDPLGRPEPSEFLPQEDGSVIVRWDLGTLEAGSVVGLRYRILPFVPGEATLDAEWRYTADFEDVQVTYEEGLRPTHQVG